MTTDMVRFFQSMKTGTLPETVLPPVNADRKEKKNGERSPRFAHDDGKGENVGVRDEEKTGYYCAASIKDSCSPTYSFIVRQSGLPLFIV